VLCALRRGVLSGTQAQSTAITREDTSLEFSKIAKNAELDQLLEGMGNMAKASWAFFTQLKEQGFSNAQAFEMTKQWQLCLFSLLNHNQRGHEK